MTVIADLSLLAFAFVADALIDAAPLIMIAAGALALSIGVLTIPLPSEKTEGSDRGLV